MGHAQQGAAVAVDQVDLDQARSRRHFLAAVPAKTVGEPVHRHDLAERAACRLAVDALEKIEPARMQLGLRLGAHPAHDPLGIGQEREDGGGWRSDLGFTPDHERFSHRCLLVRNGLLAHDPIPVC